MKLVSPSLFTLFSSKNPRNWRLIEGCDVIHKVWGRCVIERVDLAKKEIIVSGRIVALEYFIDGFFSELSLPLIILEEFSEFEAQRHKTEQLFLQRQLETETKEREKLAEIERLKFDQARRHEERRIAQIEADKQSRLYAAQNRSRQIREFCDARGITDLIHFTRIENLKSILQKGLMNRNELSGLPGFERSFINDRDRFDGHTDAICLSLSFPNYKMFYKLSNANPEIWCMLLLNPSILWELDCAFCQNNAASTSISRIPLLQRRTYETLVKMFLDGENIFRDELAIPTNYPTNPQAEILVFDTIATKYIRCVNFASISSMKAWQNLNFHPEHTSLVASDTYFKPRLDWPKWQKSQDNHNYA